MQPVRGPDRSVRLVITVALKAELPWPWLSTCGVPLAEGSFNLASLPTVDCGGVLVVATGVGRDASERAAEWIAHHFVPLAVLNVGTAGSLDSSLAIGDWLVPEELASEDGQRIRPPDRLPIPWPETLPLKRGQSLLSVLRPRDHASTRSAGSIVDMEAFWQARVFEKAAIPFHVIKGVSDYANTRTPVDFRRSMSRFRESTRRILSFLEGPGAPDISVVIPAYNRERCVGSAVDSVLSQTLVPKEVIVVDDGSTDGTSERLLAYGEKIRVISFKHNEGVSRARNRGAAEARGFWISFLDSDDYWLSSKLEQQWKYLQKNPFLEILQSGEIWIRNGRHANPCRHHEKREGWIWDHCLPRCMITPSSVLMKKSLFEQYGGFDETFPACEDYDLWLRVARDKVVGLEPTKSLVKHGGHEDQLSRRYPAMDRFRVNALMKALSSESAPGRREILRASLTAKLMILSKGSRKRGNREDWERYERLRSEICACSRPEESYEHSNNPIFVG